MHETRPSDGAMVPPEPDMISLIATEVMLLIIWCVASTTLPRQLGHHKNFVHAPIKTYPGPDYSVFD